MAFPPHIAAELAVLDRAAAAMDEVIIAADRAARDHAALLASLAGSVAPEPAPLVVLVVIAVPVEPDDGAPDATALH